MHRNTQKVFKTSYFTSKYTASSATLWNAYNQIKNAVHEVKYNSDESEKGLSILSIFLSTLFVAELAFTGLPKHDVMAIGAPLFGL